MDEKVEEVVLLLVPMGKELQADADTELPMPIHMPSDRQLCYQNCSLMQQSAPFQSGFLSTKCRYLDGLDEETRAAVIKKYIPDEPFGGDALKCPIEAVKDIEMIEMVNGGGSKVFNLLVLATGSRGTAVISNPTECLELMKKWEEATLPALGTAGLLFLHTSNLGVPVPCSCLPTCGTFECEYCFEDKQVTARHLLQVFSGMEFQTEPQLGEGNLKSSPPLQSHRGSEGPGERRCGIDETSPFLSEWWRPGGVHVAEEMAEDARARELKLWHRTAATASWQLLRNVGIVGWETCVTTCYSRWGPWSQRALRKCWSQWDLLLAGPRNLFPKNISGWWRMMCFLNCFGKVSGILANRWMVSRPGLARCVKQMQAGPDRLLSEFNSWHCFGYAWPFVPIQWWKFCIDEQEQEGKEPSDLRTTSSHFKRPLCACSDPLVHGQELRQQGPACAGRLRFTGWSGPRKYALIQFLKTGIGTDLEGKSVACWGLWGNLMTRPVSMAPLPWLKKLFRCCAKTKFSQMVWNWPFAMPSHDGRRADSLCTTLVRILAVEFNRVHKISQSIEKPKIKSERMRIMSPSLDGSDLSGRAKDPRWSGWWEGQRVCFRLSFT